MGDPSSDPAHPAHPARAVGALPPAEGVAVLRDGASWIVASGVEEVRRASGAAALRVLADVERGGGFWAGFLSYDLGRSVERVVARTVDDLGLPDLLLARFATRLVLEPGRPPRVEGASRTAHSRPAAVAHGVPPTGLGPWRSSLSPQEWAERVRAVLELLAAGDCYQVNLTRRLSAEGEADPSTLFGELLRHSPAPHAALLAFGDAAPDVSVVSASPELFLRRRGRAVETRPIKGTAADPAVLAASAKDRAENVMIVDLARNDLGRVCEFGSVAVPGLCEVEQHPGLYHLVSTVTGHLREGTGLADLVRASFPPASVTGAPKPRVLQAIEDLEPVRRGVYCGAVGWIDADRAAAQLNVAIRTFTITGGHTHLGVGGGIVADSDPASEWAETELKSARLLAAASSSSAARTGSVAWRTGPPLVAGDAR